MAGVFLALIVGAGLTYASFTSVLPKPKPRTTPYDPKTEPLDISELIPRWNVLPLAGIILTCTERDGTLAGPDLATLERVLGMTELPVQYGGGISSLHDIRRVREARAAGVILGRSLYEGKLSLEQALAL